MYYIIESFTSVSAGSLIPNYFLVDMLWTPWSIVHQHLESRLKTKVESTWSSRWGAVSTPGFYLWRYALLKNDNDGVIKHSRNLVRALPTQNEFMPYETLFFLFSCFYNNEMFCNAAYIQSKTKENISFLFLFWRVFPNFFHSFVAFFVCSMCCNFFCCCISHIYSGCKGIELRLLREDVVRTELASL